MEEFVMEIAGLAVLVQPIFKSTREYCRPYLSRKRPELTVTVSPEDLTYEQWMSEKEALQEGIRIRKFPDPFLERAAIQRKVADHLLTKRTLLVHGSTVAVDGLAYLFTAACGTGKSTHTRLWREVFGSRAVMVNDDKPFLAVAETGVIAYGSPWSGKHGLDTNIAVPLQGICILERGMDNRILPISPAEGLPVLLHQTHFPDGGQPEPEHRRLMEALAEQTPLWRMACNKSPEAALVAYRAMCPK